MEAEYVGDNGSMGFKAGATYNIRTESKMIKRNKQLASCIIVYDAKSGLWCPYDSIEVVLKNWEIVK